MMGTDLSSLHKIFVQCECLNNILHYKFKNQIHLDIQEPGLTRVLLHGYRTLNEIFTKIDTVRMLTYTLYCITIFSSQD